ncbi:MAG: glycerol-3-phosphate 1-O-acyltransferase PlsY [Defluviitaleaceae bacterium]|nr:glycerol-3-phosphate 1-O-acyltransferase PlsY [Defluviitaleaceae bacterium]
MVYRILSLLIGYAFGIIQTAFIVGKLEGIDIREHGSGNAGSTNTLRVLGKKKGAIVFFLDIFKAILAFATATLIFGGESSLSFGISHNIYFGIYAGLGAILGHCFPFYLKFKGGKGIACAIGIMLSIDFIISITMIAFCISIVILKKYVSLGSIIFVSAAPLFLAVYGFSFEIIMVSISISFICLFLHLENIKRLLSGTERKIGDTKDKITNVELEE